jgi:hypothetical protein
MRSASIAYNHIYDNTSITYSATLYLVGALPGHVSAKHPHEGPVAPAAQHRVVAQGYQVLQAVGAHRDAGAEDQGVAAVDHHLARARAHVHEQPVAGEVHAVKLAHQAAAGGHLVRLQQDRQRGATQSVTKT